MTLVNGRLGGAVKRRKSLRSPQGVTFRTHDAKRCLFAGSIPVELSQLKVIVEINLANNRLSGEMPV